MIWNAWRFDNPTQPVDLSDVDLKGRNLGAADLNTANLSNADLTNADLTQADCRATNFRGAKLRNAQIGGADLSGATLDASDLEDALLYSTNLTSTRLKGTNLSNAKFHGTIVANVDLSQCTGLEGAVHRGPSTIGIDVLARSSGQIPDAFLRGAGVPEEYITCARSLSGQTEPRHSCFISYSTKHEDDRRIAKRLYADLQKRGVRCWFAPEDLKSGDRFQDHIYEFIRLYDRVVIILSESSVKSRWVEREVHAAREREDREDRTVLLPIRIDDAVMDAPQPWAADIRQSRHIGDFTQWKDHYVYQNALERLLRDLRADSASVSSEF